MQLYIATCNTRQYCSVRGTVGPFARLRGHAHIGAESVIGNFVEVKSSDFDQKVKVNISVILVMLP